QVISLKGMNPTFVPIAPSVAPSIDIRLYKADGTFLERADITLFVRHLILPETGSYTIVVRFFSAEAGSLALKMYNVPADITNTISANGSPVTVTTTVPGQDIRLTFSGSANQKISLKIGNPYIFRSLESISGPDFQLLSVRSWVVENPAGTRNEFLGTTVLPVDGTYTILANTGNITGSLTFTLYNPTSEIDRGTLTLGGPAVSITAGAERQ